MNEQSLKGTMVEVDHETKSLLDDIKSVLLRNNRGNPKAVFTNSYRAIVREAVKKLHERMVK